MKNVADSNNEEWMQEIWDWADKFNIEKDVIPRKPKKLIKLEVLEISYNDEISTIPESIGNLKSLVTFALEGSKLKKLPNSIGELSNL